jgi:hypothetical protein
MTNDILLECYFKIETNNILKFHVIYYISRFQEI